MGAMSPHDRPARTGVDAFDARLALRASGMLGAIGTALVGANLITGLGFACPFRALTGLLCPFCGSTRMAAALVHGDLLRAWALNPVILVAVLVWMVCAGLWIVEVLGGPAVRPPTFVRPLTQRRIYLGVGLALTVFTVARNLP